jgi:transposase
MTINDLYRQLFGRGGTTKGTDIEMSEHGRQGGLSTGQPYKFTDDIKYAIKLTQVGDIYYVGYAVPGSLESDSVWQCQKIDTSSGIKIEFADGDVLFNNVATDLTALNYS